MARSWRKRLYETIYEANTFGGWLFDVVLILAIVLSVLAVLLESVPSIEASFGAQLRVLEWVFTLLFSVEYVLRIISVKRPKGYVLSFYGLVDLLSVAPTYAGLFFPSLHVLLVVRILRLLRLFRVFKMARYLKGAQTLSEALRRSKPKIVVFLVAVISIVTVMGAVMYVVEGPKNGFTSIPVGIYWAIVTMTTVGFGDIVPLTVLGRFLAASLMILGYAIIAVPTGIISLEIARSSTNNEACPSCGREGHADDAKFCRFCGSRL